jgi:tRNA(Ile)-lysidine synthase
MGRRSPLSLDEIRPVLDRLLKGPLALAVSGGADSMALMHLIAAWWAERRATDAAPPIVLTVDHGLRPGSADEAIFVGHEAARLGFEHTTLVWAGLKPASGLQAAARAARYSLMSNFLDREAHGGKVSLKRSIVTAHHADDQAETFLMRLARGSGLDGLCGMRPTEVIAADDQSCTILRPLLEVPKVRLVATLELRGLAWREDPSNALQDFERVRVRAALERLNSMGISGTEIQRSTARLARAREAVAASLAEVLPRLARLHGGLFAEVDAALFQRLPDEFRIRTLAVLLRSYGGASPPARLSQIEALAAQMSEVSDHRYAVTLGGCRIERNGDGAIQIWREIGRDGLPDLDLQPGARLIWDERFVVTLAAEEKEPVRICALDAEDVRALGSDLVMVGELRGLRIPAGALETLPSFRRGKRILAVPYFKGFRERSPGCSAEFVAAKALSGAGLV